MDHSNSTMARQLAQVASAFEHQRTGHVPKSVTVVLNRELQIRGKVTPPATKPHYLLNEYGVGDYYRAFSITDDVDAEKISADLKDGVLTVHLPKAESLKQRRIRVNA